MNDAYLRYIPLILSSSVNSGAYNKSDDGSTFSVNIENGLLVPKGAKYCYLTCQAAEVWNTSPNILAGINDKLYFTDGLGSLIITIPQGLYDINALNNEINRQILEAGHDNDSIQIYGNSATQKTFIKFKNIGASIDFTQPRTFRVILGFDSVVIGPSVTVDDIFDSNNVAAFNTIDYFVLHSDLVNYGIRVNNKFNQAVAQVLIEASPGSQILHQPNNPPLIPCPELIGLKKTVIRAWITDQDNNLVDTAGEDFAMRLMIYYLV